MWMWFKEWIPFLIPALSNFALVLAGIWMSLPEFATSVEKNRKRSFGVLCLALGIVGLTYDARERHHSDKASQELFQEVKTGLGKTDLELQKTDTLLDKMSTVETCISLIPALDVKISRIVIQMSLAKKRQDTIEVSKLQKQLDEAKADKMVLSKQVISNAWLVVQQLRYLARKWSSEEADAKDDKERDRIHSIWNNRGLPLGNAYAVTLQLLTLLPEMSPSDKLKEIQLQEMKIHGQGHGGTGPEPLQGDADYLEALIKRVIAANPELAK
jgi:hypothetical protein